MVPNKRWVTIFTLISSMVVGLVDMKSNDSSYDPFVKLGDNCIDDKGCKDIKNGECDESLRKCVCSKAHPVVHLGRKCLNVTRPNQTCETDSQCSAADKDTHCANSICACLSGKILIADANGTLSCIIGKENIDEMTIPQDFAVIGMVIGLVAMFILICVAVRMFSKDRFEERPSIFSSPRLLKNVLARKSREKNLSDRRGSHTRIPSRQPSVYSAGKSPTASRGSGVQCGSRRPSALSLADGRHTSPGTPTRVVINVDEEPAPSAQ